MSVLIHCRAFTHVLIRTESFQGSYPYPPNKHLYTIIKSAFLSIHHHRPSARATPMLGIAIKPATKIWHPMWGLWLVVIYISTELFKVPGALWCWSAAKSSHWILQGQTVFCFPHSLHCSPTPDHSWGIVIFFRFNFSNCSFYFIWQFLD